MTIAPVLFLDTETTSLEDDRQIWNLGMVLRRPGQERLLSRDLIITDVDLTNANEDSLRIGHFDQRHPLRGGNPGEAELVTTGQAAHLLHEFTTPAQGQRVHIVGCVPDFDTGPAKRLLAAHDLPWQAHYHLIDAENLAIGFLAGSGWFDRHEDEVLAAERHRAQRAVLAEGDPNAEHDRPLLRPGPPYSSETISRALGVQVMRAERRHTALGDALWAMAMYDAVMAHTPASLRLPSTHDQVTAGV